jgi:hypothetical protein
MHPETMIRTLIAAGAPAAISYTGPDGYGTVQAWPDCDGHWLAWARNGIGGLFVAHPERPDETFVSELLQELLEQTWR